MSTTKLYLIRHAEAEGNLYRRIQGQYDSLITDNGYRQIAALQGRFEGVPVDAVYSSDLFRTMTTARAVYKPKGLPLVTRKGLREINMGIYEDQTWAEAARNAPQDLALFNATSPQFHAPGGEGFQDVMDRVCATLSQIVKNHPGQTVAVFSHGLAIRSALARFHGLPVEEMNQLEHSDNTAVSLVEFTGGRVQVVFENDSSHLPEEISTLSRQAWWRSRDGSQADINLWFRPLDMEREGELYAKAREEAWVNIHGSMQNFDGPGFQADALRNWRFDRRSVMCAMLGEQPVGVIQMDLERDADKGVGYIPFFYMSPEYRKKGLGVQLLGQAVSTYRPLGRKYLRLRCAPDNLVAQRFYKRYGFRKIAEVQGSRVPLDMMEKYIGYESEARG